MKFPLSMLLDLVRTSFTAEQLGDLLTMAGFELEGIETVEGEPVLDIKVVSNRGDGLSVFGLAREVLAKDPHSTPTELYKKAADRFQMPDVGAQDIWKQTSVEIQTDDCTRFACRIFKGAFNGASPDWLAQRVRHAGMRSLGLLVDLTNYVMLELGQPMHAYDYDKLRENRIVVRKAKRGEHLVTLNGDDHELNEQQMVICDADRPVGVAGVMGGLDTEVSETTTTILLEAAHFVNTSVRRTRKQLGLSTEASYRFERSVDPDGVVAALNRFALLLMEAAPDSTCVPGVADLYKLKPVQVVIPVRMSRVHTLLGMDVPTELAKDYLRKLGFAVEGSGEDFKVVAPTWRPDMIREDDVIEEIGRVHGYDKIPEQLPRGHTTQGGVFGFDLFVQSVRETIVRQGFIQTISHSLMDVHPLDDPMGERLGPRNPSSPEMAVLRNSILPNLADNAKRNGARNLQLFEIGNVFGRIEGKEGSLATEYRQGYPAFPVYEAPRVGLFAVGTLVKEHWEKRPAPQASFFHLKAVVEEVVREMDAEPRFRQTEQDPRFHPTRQAVITVGEVGFGIIGQIHPDKAEQLDLSPETFLAELDLICLYSYVGAAKPMRPVSRNPAVRRDIAILIDKSIPYAAVEAAISEACGGVLEKQWLFDVYEGQNIPAGKHSLAIAIQLRKFGENFTDEEANQVRDSAVAALVALGATQR